MEDRKKEVLKGPAERETKDGEPVFSLTNAATVMECTGLIQVPPRTEEELENYPDVYRFNQPEPVVPKEEERIGEKPCPE